MFHLSHDPISEDNIDCHVLGIVSTISNLIVPCLLSINLAISYAKQGFKVLLLDLNLSQPMMSLFFNNNNYFGFTSNKIFDQSLDLNFIDQNAFSKKFSSNGLLTIIPANIDMKSRMKIQDISSADNKSNLIKLINFINEFKQNYSLIIINMPNGSDLRHLTQGCLVVNHNFLLIDQESISVAYGIDLIANLEAIHPLIEFKGLILYNYQYNVNFIDDERPLLEQAFNLPVIVTLPELPSQEVTMFDDDSHNSFKLLNYYKFISQELFSFINNPNQHPFVANKRNGLIEVLIIANNAGIPLFTSYLKGSQTEKSTILYHDEILASATLTAIVSGITEVIKEITENLSGETKLIKQKHLNLVIEYDNPLRAMMLTQRNEEIIRSKIMIFLNLFKQKYKKEIENFSGASKGFKEAQYLVEEVF